MIFGRRCEVLCWTVVILFVVGHDANSWTLADLRLPVAYVRPVVWSQPPTRYATIPATSTVPVDQRSSALSFVIPRDLDLGFDL